MKQDLIKKENANLKKKIKSLTIERDSLEAELKYLYSRLDDYKEMNDINTKILFHIRQNKGGSGRRSFENKIIAYIEIMRIFHEKKSNKKSRTSVSDALISFNKRKDTEEKIGKSALYKFLKKINFKTSILYTPEFFKDKTNNQIFIYLDNKFNFDAKV